MNEKIYNDYLKLSSEITEKLDNTASYESWLIIQEYIDILIKENQQLKENWNKLKQYLLGGVSSDNYIITQNAMLFKMQELEKRLEVGEKQYNDVVEEKDELKSLYDSTILENQKLKEKIKQIIEYAYGTDTLVSEYEQLCKIAEVE